MTDRPSSALGNISDSEEVEAQVRGIVTQFAPGHDLSRIGQTFALLRQAFQGHLPGYTQLKTQYHNPSHTNEVVLCAARLLHGMHLAGQGLDEPHIDAALIGALMHDFGYLMKDAEAADGSTGAKFTATHVARGAEFVQNHLANLIDLPDEIRDATVKVVQITDHRKHPDWVVFDNPQQQMAAYATASADLVGQMANREYLERLLFLYFEFQEARIPGFGDIHELMEKTADFYRITRSRIDHDLNGMAKHLQHHFAVARGEERNFYLESIDRNLGYLQHLVQEGREHRLKMLKRGGVVEHVMESSPSGNKGLE
jgi:hypothetical protein